ncbi:MAG: anti-sigma factor [Alphaproteobacteria bacterium]|nr:anti-sigma factor [Alphaproteobacteria bacterium]
MTCDDARDLLEAYHDGELGAEDCARVEAHLQGCAACARELASLRALSDRVRGLGRQPVPDGLATRITSLVAQSAPVPTNQRPWARMAASHLAAALLGAGAVALVASATLRDPAPMNDLVTAHVRGLALEDFGSVRSGNPHAIKPWFAGKLAFSPRVSDLADDGFPLLSGRVDYVAGKPAAALIYGRRQHRITVFIAPAGSTAAAVNGQLQGYNVESWQADGLRYEAVSDLNRDELTNFAALLRTR